MSNPGVAAVIELKPILDVREIPPCASKLRQALPSLLALVREVAAPVEPKVLDYLRQGMVCGVYNDPRLMYDVLSPGKRLEPDANLLLTDGIWLWPKALVSYVATYHLQLPAEFIAHAEQNAWRIDPSAISLRELSSDAFDAVLEKVS